jgi:transcriptional regulator with XRE-family HTH domain
MVDSSHIAARIGRVVRAERTVRDMSLNDLARASGLSKTILARIERGDGNPSIETLWRLTRALGIPLGWVLGENLAPRVRAIPARSAEAVRSASGMDGWLIHTDSRAVRSDLFELDLPKGIDQRSPAHMPGTEEVVYCIDGRLRAGPVGEEIELGPGDAVWFAADGDHHYEALADGRYLCLMLYPPGA